MGRKKSSVALGANRKKKKSDVRSDTRENLSGDLDDPEEVMAEFDKIMDRYEKNKTDDTDDPDDPDDTNDTDDIIKIGKVTNGKKKTSKNSDDNIKKKKTSDDSHVNIKKKKTSNVADTKRTAKKK